MRVNKKDIHRKRQELGQEPPKPSYGPQEVQDPIENEIQSIQGKSERAEMSNSDESRKHAGTNFKNQYR